MSRFLLVRHGRTKLHNDERFWGKTDANNRCLPFSIYECSPMCARYAHPYPAIVQPGGALPHENLLPCRHRKPRRLGFKRGFVEGVSK